LRIAITGATGFLGRHVVREARSRGLDVVAVLRSAGRAVDLPPGTASVVLDIADGDGDHFAAMGAPDILIHLAWDGLPNYQSMHHLDTELPAQMRFLTSCVAAGLGRLVASGTCFEYGMVNGEQSETSPTRPCTRYGEAKDQLRETLQQLQAGTPYELAWLRLFYLYGPGQSPRSLYSQFQAAIARSEAGFDMSPGDQVRDFLPVQEAARLVVEVALARGDAGVVNLCSGKPITVKALADGWLAATGSGMRLNLGRLPYAEFEPMAFWGNRDKLGRLLGDS